MIAVTSLTAKDYKNYFEKAINYESYLKNFQTEIASGDQSAFAKYLPQNWQRQSRLDRKLKINDALLNTIQKLETTQNWLVITEHWCGDASQIIPIFNKIAKESNNNINLKFIYRDENLELMDEHLTDGRSRSIPMVLKLDEDFNFISSYGPRPEEAQKLVKDLLSKGASYDLPLHSWYAKDKQRSLQEDMVIFLEK